MSHDTFETRVFGGLSSVDVDTEIFAGGDAGGSLVGCGTAEASGLRMSFVGAEGNEVEAEGVGKGGLELGDLGVEFEEDAGLGLLVEIAGSHLVAEGKRLAVDWGESLSDRKSGVQGHFDSKRPRVATDMAKPALRANRAGAPSRGV